jgi:hypothetical protein
MVVARKTCVNPSAAHVPALFPSLDAQYFVFVSMSTINSDLSSTASSSAPIS